MAGLASLSVVLDGAGTGTGQAGPRRAGESWQITRLTTRGSAATEPTLDVRRGSALGPVVDSTRRGNLAVSETDLPLLPGEYLTIVYSGGAPGAVMSFVIEGTAGYGVPE